MISGEKALSAFFNPASIEESLFRIYWRGGRAESDWLSVLASFDDTLDGGLNAELGRGTAFAFSSDPPEESDEATEEGTEAETNTGNQELKDVISQESSRSLTQWDSDKSWDVISKFHDIGRGTDRAISFSLHLLIRDWLQSVLTRFLTMNTSRKA